MSSRDWSWKIGEAVERLRTRYEHIGRKSGAPFLAIVYPPEAEPAVLKEWQTQISALRPEFDVRPVDVMEITQGVVAEIGTSNIVNSFAEPMPGSNPETELGQMWITAVAEAVTNRMAERSAGKPAVSLQRLAGLFPAAGPRDVMQRLWDSSQLVLDGPVIVLIPGEVVGSNTYNFVGHHNEFMYRGDLL